MGKKKEKLKQPRNWHQVAAWQRTSSGPMGDKRKSESKNGCREWDSENEEVEKKAILIEVNILSRVVVNEDASESEILEAGYDKLLRELKEDRARYTENICDISADEECPYDPKQDG